MITTNTHSGSTVANTVLDLTNSSWHNSFIVTNRSTVATPVELWVRFDGTAPTVAGDGCFLVEPASLRNFVNIYTTPSEPGTNFAGSTTPVQVISNAICAFEIEYS